MPVTMEINNGETGRAALNPDQETESIALVDINNCEPKHTDA